MPKPRRVRARAAIGCVATARENTDEQTFFEVNMKESRSVPSAETTRKMYIFFRDYADAGVPSFGKFARKIGVTLAELEAWRGDEEFEKAYRECNEIRRDYLIDNALARRLDPSLTKFLLTAEFGMGEDEDDDTRSLEIRLEVVD